MEILCTRPGCHRPQNQFADLDDATSLKTAQQKYCTSCGMPLILGGRYLPSRLLGKGGFGTAFLARDRYTPTMRECVVKQFQPASDLGAKGLEIAQGLFEREAAVLERLGSRHDQIPDLYAFFPLIVPTPQGNQDEQFFYLVQEYINGQDLETELKTKGSFSEAEVRFILEEILKVLKFVHENGSIHRDIKPSNIMRDKDGRLYLLDFGAVKEVTAGVGVNPGRSTGIYSPGYAPPEQMQGSQVYPATDLYALAVTCINLLTGKAPEELFDAYNSCWEWRQYAQVSPRMAAVLDKMLQTTPKDRFISAEATLNALQDAPGHQSIPQTPVVPHQATVTPTAPPPSIPNIQPNVAAPITPQATTPPPTVNPSPQAVTPSRRSRFSLVEMLIIAAFTGFEGALLLIAFKSLMPLPIAVGLWGSTVGGLIFVQYRRIIEGKDFPIFAIISLLVMLIPALRGGFTILGVGAIAILAAAAMVAVTALFRLVYQILSKFL